jgi:hypothetical protein
MKITQTKVFFIHLPKCGGTTIVEALENWFGIDQVCQLPPTTRLHLDPLPRDVVASAVYGHVPYPIIGLFDGEPTVFSMLREPVSRTLSAYLYLQDKTEHPLHRAFSSGVHNIVDFLRSPTFAFHAGNLQTRMLGASDAWAARVLAGNVPGGTQPWRSLMREPLDLCLERAFSRIAQRNFVLGTQNDLLDGINRLADALGMPHRHELPRLNARANRPNSVSIHAPTAAELELIREANSYDLQLYQAARVG